ncbi:MAG: hypothetical protein IPJ46_00610 [Anaerolineales bacterium]|nr:hypothetical protein [Anaerolineales bacterium]
MIIDGEIPKPLNDSLDFIGARSNLKGFLCEYMTSGRVLVLGKGAKVTVLEVGERALHNLRNLLTIHADELKHNHQIRES